MKAPFPYFGGKSAVVHLVWEAIGADVANYVEPFAGSLAVLLSRPTHAIGIETVNDADGLLANFWRATAMMPKKVAEYADWPVNEADLHARHLWLVGQREALTERLMGDSEFCDPKAAGWWVWGICQWIGSGWCSGKGPWQSVGGVLQKAAARDKGRGINRQIPHLGNKGRGINRQIPHLGDKGRGESRSAYVHATMQELRSRLRDVRVACGDFERVLGPSPTYRLGVTGVFLDPPYDTGDSKIDAGVMYNHFGGAAARAREWAIEAGKNPKMRIVLAGYVEEHEEQMQDAGWKLLRWKARGGYGSQGGGDGRLNAGREALWFSPHCNNIGASYNGATLDKLWANDASCDALGG